MHGEYEQPVVGHVCEFGLEPGELGFAQGRVVAAGGARVFRRRRRTPVAHVVEHHEHRAGVLEGVVGRSVPVRERLERVGVRRRELVEFVIAGDVVPGNAERRDDAVVAGEHGQVVEQDVAHGHAEGGFGADEFAHHAVADVVEFFLRLWLRIGKENGLEARRLLLSIQGEVDALGQGAGGFDTGIAEPRRRSVRAVQIVEARQTIRVQGRHVAGGLGDEDDAVAVDFQFVGPVAVGERDVAAVGDAHAGDARLVRVDPPVAVQIAEHAAANGVRMGRGGKEADEGKPEGEPSGARHGCYHSQLAWPRILQALPVVDVTRPPCL